MPDQKKPNSYHPPIYYGDQDPDRLPYEGPPIRAEPARTNRGRRTPQEGSGVVSGAGAAAGGTSGIEEDYDDDSVSGGGPNLMPTRRKKDKPRS